MSCRGFRGGPLVARRPRRDRRNIRRWRHGWIIVSVMSGICANWILAGIHIIEVKNSFVVKGMLMRVDIAALGRSIRETHASNAVPASLIISIQILLLDGRAYRWIGILKSYRPGRAKVDVLSGSGGSRIFIFM